ncbi:MAG: tyrosine-type recombinase/integrase [Epsilonproteobacteria bacterium]|nr:tyrosine-type recombinase/integrase [Campylobacterota bacterium]
MLGTARKELDKSKERKRNGEEKSNITLDELFIIYMETQPLTDWTHKKKHVYDLYIGNSGLSNIIKEPTKELLIKREQYNRYKIGHIPIQEIIPNQIGIIISKMETEHNLSDRTRKGIIEVLNPVFKFAMINRYTDFNPTEYLSVKVSSQKKIVIDAGEKLKALYRGIIELYKDEPFYKALFLFGFSGRRKGEVLNLKWENVDFKSNYYWIEQGSRNTNSTKNNDKQQFPLFPVLKNALLGIKDDRAGLVFKSPITGKALTGIDRPMKKLKAYTGIENLTFHYFRNILVSAYAEQGVEAITLSGILGHKDTNTISKYLSNSTMKSGLKGLEVIDVILNAEIIE